MDPLSLLIEQEVAKLRILESEVVSRKQRIATLRAMQTSGELDALLEGKLAPPNRQPVEQQRPNLELAAEPRQASIKLDESSLDAPGGGRRKKGAVKRALLGALKRDEWTSLASLMQYMQGIGHPLDSKRVRGEMWAYKQEDLIEADGSGLYKLTEKGEAFAEGQKGETAVGAAVSGATKSVEDEL